LPSNGSTIRHPPFLHGVPSGWFPRFVGTIGVLRRPESFPPRFVSFAWRYRGYARCFAPTGCGRPKPVGLDFCSPGALTGTRPRRSQGAPRFLGEPSCVHALGWHPGGPSAPGPCSAEDVAFRSPHDVGSPLRSLEADYHGLHTRCLRFGSPGYPDDTQDSLPVGDLPYRVGLTYWVHYEEFPAA
jgi:hypothetical protein